MAERYYTAASGNWSTTANWDGGVSLPGSADDVYANGKSITIDQSISVASLRTTAGTTAVAGGSFTVSANGFTSTVTGQITAGSTTCLTVSVSGANSHTIDGGCTISGSATTASARGVQLTGTGTLNITANAVGGTQGNAAAIHSTTTGTVNLTGNATGGTGIAAHGINNNSSGTVSVSGTCTGGPSGFATVGCAVNTGTGTLVNVVGGGVNQSYGASLSTGTLSVSGTATGGSLSGAHGLHVSGVPSSCTVAAATGGVAGAYGVNNNSTGTITFTGTITGGSGSMTAFGAFNSSTGTHIYQGNINASSTSPAIGDGTSAAHNVLASGITLTNSTGIMAIEVGHVGLQGSITWVFAKEVTPGSYSGTQTLSGASGGASAARQLVGMVH